VGKHKPKKTKISDLCRQITSREMTSQERQMRRKKAAESK
jgi:hypothetical protein